MFFRQWWYGTRVQLGRGCCRTGDEGLTGLGTPQIFLILAPCEASRGRGGAGAVRVSRYIYYSYFIVYISIAGVRVFKLVQI